MYHILVFTLYVYSKSKLNIKLFQLLNILDTLITLTLISYFPDYRNILVKTKNSNINIKWFLTINIIN